MPVKRIWFPNSPSGTIDSSQQLQIGIGYPQIVLIPVEIIDGNIEYYRRYLNDPLIVKPLVPTVPAVVIEEPVAISKYLRRYLNDTLTVEPLHPTIVVSAPAEVSELSKYFRRYLNDPIK